MRCVRRFEFDPQAIADHPNPPLLREASRRFRERKKTEIDDYKGQIADLEAQLHSAHVQLGIAVPGGGIAPGATTTTGRGGRRRAAAAAAAAVEEEEEEEEEEEGGYGGTSPALDLLQRIATSTSQRGGARLPPDLAHELSQLVGGANSARVAFSAPFGPGEGGKGRGAAPGGGSGRTTPIPLPPFVAKPELPPLPMLQFFTGAPLQLPLPPTAAPATPRRAGACLAVLDVACKDIIVFAGEREWALDGSVVGPGVLQPIRRGLAIPGGALTFDLLPYSRPPDLPVLSLLLAVRVTGVDPPALAEALWRVATSTEGAMSVELPGVAVVPQNFATGITEVLNAFAPSDGVVVTAIRPVEGGGGPWKGVYGVRRVDSVLCSTVSTWIESPTRLPPPTALDPPGGGSGDTLLWIGVVRSVDSQPGPSEARDVSVYGGWVLRACEGGTMALLVLQLDANLQGPASSISSGPAAALQSLITGAPDRTAALLRLASSIGAPPPPPPPAFVPPLWGSSFQPFQTTPRGVVTMGPRAPQFSGPQFTGRSFVSLAPGGHVMAPGGAPGEGAPLVRPPSAPGSAMSGLDVLASYLSA